MTKTVFLVDDDDAIRHSASFMLRHAGYTVKTFPDGVTFLDEYAPNDSACILLDVRMPVMDGLAVQTALQERGNTMPIIVLTGHGDVSVAVQAMKNGAIEFLEKPYEKKALLEAIETGFSRLADAEAQTGLKNDAIAKLTRLTSRETEVLDCLVEGMTNKAIADALSISPRTVEIHRANLMEKLEADSLSAALRIAFEAERGRNTTA
ncbi:response regulator [Hyphomonas sp.]|jgi:two-component system response regulator FixJ|uniref:response regulator transcription factor n=1 Tax=Hyphomonas sp. TaxID=87 RepID=UPI00041EA90D|nr:response regulator [Hyphomonas sp.]MEE2921952.1 response regulator [Pseudomonadota bacterium]